MSLPAPPAARIPYDRDGTLGYLFDAGASSTTLFTPTQMAAFNRESASGWNLPSTPFSYVFGFIFPVPMTVSHYFLSAGSSNNTLAPQSIEYSLNTSSGQDGTWTSIGAVVASVPPMVPAYRTAITALGSPLTGIRGIRLNWGGGYAGSGSAFNSLHLYGRPTNLSDRVEFWHPDLDTDLYSGGALDFGDLARGVGAVRRVRLKNRSTSLAANNIAVSLEALTDSTPTMLSQLLLRYGSGSLVSSFTIPYLAPGAISDVIEVHEDLVAGALLGPWSQRLIATPASWS